MRWKNAEDIVVDALPEEANLRSVDMLLLW